jgi:hypothetical protein
MALGADGTQFHEELIDITHGPGPGILTGERSETLDNLLTSGDRREGQVAAQPLIAPPVQHRLEHLLGRVEQSHIPGDPLPGRAGRTTLSAHIISSHKTRFFRILCETMAKRPVTARIFRFHPRLLQRSVVLSIPSRIVLLEPGTSEIAGLADRRAEPGIKAVEFAPDAIRQYSFT